MRFIIEVPRGAVRRPLLSLVVVVAVAGAYLAGVARADGIPTSDALYYGGVVDDGGVLVEGTRDVVVELFDAATGGSVQCRTEADATSFSAGRFRIALDASCVTAVQSYPDLYAQVSVGAVTLPRTKLGAVPYAIEAERAALASAADDADTLDGNDSAAFAAATHEHSAAALTSGTLGVARGGTGIGSLTAEGNKLLAVNAAGSAYETRALTGTLGEVSVTHASGTTTIALAPGVLHSCTYHEANAALSSSVSCPSGKKVTGGGSACAPSNDQGQATENRLKYSRPSSDRSSWSTTCTDGTKGAYTYAICCAE